MTSTGDGRGTRRALVAVAATATLLLVGAPVDAQTDSGEDGRASASAVLQDGSGATVGTVVLQQDGDTVRVALDAAGLTPGFHGFHLHTVGDCTPPDFTSAGGHFNPDGRPHGEHAGDLPFVRVGDDGRATLTASTSAFAVADLFDEDGTAVMIHADPDNLANIPDRYSSSAEGAPTTGPDEATLATGDAGARAACGELVRPATGAGDGYWIAAADGGVFAVGDAPFLGSAGGIPLAAPVVDLVAAPGGDGYWLAAADGGVFAFGDAPFLGGMGGTRLIAEVVGAAAPPADLVATLRDASGTAVGTVALRQVGGAVDVVVNARGLTPGFHGFHVHAVGDCTPPDFTSAGGHFNPGEAVHGAHAGDLPALLVGSDGHASSRFRVASFTVEDLLDADGSAVIVHAGRDNLANIPDRYSSSEPGAPASGPDAATLATGDAGARAACGEVAPVGSQGDAYWLVAADGGVFSFGDAAFHGSMGGTRLAAPVVAMAATPTGGGYWLVAADGGVFAFGDAAFEGSAAGTAGGRVIGVAPTDSGSGYWLVEESGRTHAFGDAQAFALPPAAVRTAVAAAHR